MGLERELNVAGRRDGWEMKLRLDDQFLRLTNFLKGTKKRFNGKLRRAMAANQALKGRHEGQRCFILGTAPSILEQDLAPLANEFTFAVNFFYQHPQYAAVAPNYYAIIDHKLVNGGWPEWLVDHEPWPGGMLKRVSQGSPNTELFLGADFCDHPALLEAAGDHPTWWIGDGLNFYLGYGGAIDLRRTLPAINVMQTCVHIAWYMGFSEVYLLGIGLDGLPRDLMGMPSHFYAGPAENADLNFAKIERDLIQSGYGFRGWRAMAEYYDAKGLSVVNLTPDGLLTAFPRRSLEDVLAS
jgi:hypothetical protein